MCRGKQNARFDDVFGRRNRPSAIWLVSFLLRTSSEENSRPAGFADALGRKIVLQYGFHRKTKKKKMLEEK
jgi:1,2-phenylacetyl-CoA epoxidase PaaB subunit